jgi:hypothetical protein
MSTLETRAARAGVVFAVCLVAFLILTTLAGPASPLR